MLKQFIMGIFSSSSQDREDSQYDLPYMKQIGMQAQIYNDKRGDVYDFQQVLKNQRSQSINEYRQNYVKILFTNEKSSQKGSGTGFIFKSFKNKMYALTCLHNIYEVKKQNGFVQRGLQFHNFKVYRQSKKNNFQKRIVYSGDEIKTLVFNPPKNLSNETSRRLQRMDFALIEIEKKSQQLQDIISDVPLEINIQKTMNNLFIFGYAYQQKLKGTGANAHVEKRQLVIYKERKNLNQPKQINLQIKMEELVYQNTTYPGYSGTPILHFNPKTNQIRIIGIHTHSRKRSQNCALKLDQDVIQWIDNTLQKQLLNSMTLEEKRQYQFQKELKSKHQLIQIELLISKPQKQWLYGTPQDNALIQIFKKIKNKKILEKIKMTNKNLTNFIINELKQFLNLKYLDLSYNHMQNKDVKQLLKIPSLQTLLFKNNGLDYNMLNTLQSLPPCQNLRFLYLGNLCESDNYQNLIENQVKESNFKKKLLESNLVFILNKFPNLYKLEIGFAKISKSQLCEPRLHLIRCEKQLNKKIQNLEEEYAKLQAKFQLFQNFMQQLRKKKQMQQLTHYQPIEQEYKLEEEDRLQKQQLKNHLKIQFYEDLIYKQQLIMQKKRQHYSKFKRNLTVKQKQQLELIQNDMNYKVKKVNEYISKLKIHPNYKRKDCICFEGGSCII